MYLEHPTTRSSMPGTGSSRSRRRWRIPVPTEEVAAWSTPCDMWTQPLSAVLSRESLRTLTRKSISSRSSFC